MKVLVVGGGTAGLITALILKKRLNITVDVVYSDTIGIVGVGEGSTEHFNEFMNFMGIDSHTIIKECDATFKCGIMFDGWAKKPYLHSVTYPYSLKAGQYNFVYGSIISEGLPRLNSSLSWNNLIEKSFLSKDVTPPYNQYHFNTFKLNEFLKKIALSLGIGLFEDTVKDVVISESGSIDSVIGEKQTYSYDFYIDSTGFRRVLINKLGARWISFNKYLKMNSAITFPTKDENDYNLWTLSKGMKNGWMFSIPVWGRYGNGYIFDKNYISADEAKKEVEDLLGFEVQVNRSFTFDPGYLDKVWINNCVAVGLSGSFVEPLEATSIGTSIQQAFLLMHHLPHYNKKSIESYNASVENILLNIRDFLILHYLTNRTDSTFWKDQKGIEIPDSLQNKLDIWRSRLPISEDFSKDSAYILFKEENFISVLYGLNLFDEESIQKNHRSLNIDLQSTAISIIADKENKDANAQVFTHKQFITLVREYM
jgi:flavin-dependent dehydrogenase